MTDLSALYTQFAEAHLDIESKGSTEWNVRCPIHGECGGYMVLGETLQDADGATHAMAGLLPVATSYHRRKLHLGYRVARLCESGLLGAAGTRLVGHEFHYASELSPIAPEETALARVTDAEGVDLGLAGHRVGPVTGSFFHLIATDPP